MTEGTAGQDGGTNQKEATAPGEGVRAGSLEEAGSELSGEKGRGKGCEPRAQPDQRLRAEGASMVWSESCHLSLVQMLELECVGTGWEQPGGWRG